MTIHQSRQYRKSATIDQPLCSRLVILLGRSHRGMDSEHTGAPQLCFHTHIQLCSPRLVDRILPSHSLHFGISQITERQGCTTSVWTGPVIRLPTETDRFRTNSNCARWTDWPGPSGSLGPIRDRYTWRIYKRWNVCSLTSG